MKKLEKTIDKLLKEYPGTGAGGGNIGTGQVPLPNEQGFSGNEQGLNEPPQATGEQPPTLAGLQ